MDEVAGQLAEGVGHEAVFLALVVGFTLGVSFFCSLCEAAIYAISNAQVAKLAQSGTRSGRLLKRLRDDIEEPIAAILTLNTIAHTAGATVAGVFAARLFGSVGVGIFSAVFTLAILYISEIIPKTMGVLYADTLAPVLARPVVWTIRGLMPLVWACRVTTKLFPKGEGTYGETSEEDLLVLAQHGARAGSLRADEARWMQNALRLDQMRVSEVMTPRTVVFSLPKETSLAEAVKEVARWPHSRAPVTEGGDLDEICGLVLQRDLYNAVANGRVEGTLESLMRPVVMVPEGMRVGDLLAKALRERKHLFVVGDEYGGTAGVVSLEDAIESLLGSEIVDEYDRDADMQKVARELADQKLQAASDDGDSYKPEPGKPESGKPESDRPESDTSGSG